MTEFASLRPKTSSYQRDDNNKNKTAKGANNCVT